MVCVALLAATQLTACPDPPDDALACEACAGFWAYTCTNGTLICVADDTQAANQCPGGTWTSKTNCVNAPLQGTGSGGYPNWDPDSYVAYNRSTEHYEVDQTLIDDIAADGAVLFVQDRARLVEDGTDYFTLESVASDDLAYHLGFRNGDTVLTVNGISLKAWPDYVDAIASEREKTYFVVVVSRNGSTVTLTYDIV